MMSSESMEPIENGHSKNWVTQNCSDQSMVDGEKPGELIPERRGSILEGKKKKATCCDVACLTFQLPHITTGSIQSHQ